MKEIDVRKETTKKFRKHASYNFSYGAFYAFFIIVCFAIAYFLPETLILTIPLIIIPFTFAFQFNTSIDNTSLKDQGFSLKKFFGLFKVYFQRQFFGAYRLLEGFFKSLGVFMGFYFVSALILVYTSLFKDPAFMQVVSSIEEMTDMAGIENILMDAILNNDAFIDAAFLAMPVSLFPALLMFVHHVGTNSIKIHLSVASGQKMRMPEVHLIHRMGFSSFRKSFYKDYFKTVWWFTPSIAILYYGGVVTSYFLLPNMEFTGAVIGTALALLFISFAAPYYFSCIETLFIKYQDKYIEASIAQSIKALNELKAQNKMSVEEEKEIEQYINQTKEFLAKAKEEENSENEEQKNSDDSES